MSQQHCKGGQRRLEKMPGFALVAWVTMLPAGMVCCGAAADLAQIALCLKPLTGGYNGKSLE